MLIGKAVNIVNYKLSEPDMVKHLFDNFKTVSFFNPVNYVKSREFRVDGVDTFLSDGIFSCAIFSLLGFKYIKRFSFDFTSLAESFFKHCIANKLKVYLVGAKAEEIKNFKNLLSNEYPDLNVVGFSDGYLKDEGKRARTLKHIGETKADVVICGMGCPLQEGFIVEAVQKNQALKLAITCGGFFHQFQHSKDYYPYWVNKFKLRMPYRYYKEPHTRDRLNYYPKFFVLSFYDFFSSLLKK